jgi:AcrR family transcriptional regulator
MKARNVSNVTTVTVSDSNVSARKKQLRDAALRYLLRNGVANFSLRPMAAALGTSARILMFHFKSKEGLLRDVFVELQKRVIDSFSQVAFETEGSNEGSPIERFWAWATARKNAPYLRLLYEAQIVALQNPNEYSSYLRDASKGWQSAVLRALAPPLRSETIATLCIAVFDGLFLEFMSTGDGTRLTRALKKFVTLARSNT